MNPDYKLEALKARQQLAAIILKDHGENCLCSECQIAEKDIKNYLRYTKLKAEMEAI